MPTRKISGGHVDARDSMDVSSDPSSLTQPALSSLSFPPLPHPTVSFSSSRSCSSHFHYPSSLYSLLFLSLVSIPLCPAVACSSDVHSLFERFWKWMERNMHSFQTCKSEPDSDCRRRSRTFEMDHGRDVHANCCRNMWVFGLFVSCWVLRLAPPQTW